MSVFVWINSERELLNLLPWSRWLATELDQRLIILCYGGAYGPSNIAEIDKDIDYDDLLLKACCREVLDVERVLRIRGKECLEILKDETFDLGDLSKSYLLCGRRGLSSLSDCHDNILIAIEKLKLNWAIVKSSRQVPEKKNLRILIPTSGGQESNQAFKLLDQLNQNHAIALLNVPIDTSVESYQKATSLLESIASRKGLEERDPKLVVRSSSSVQKALLEEIQIGYHLVIIGSSNARFVEKIIHSNLEEDLLLDSQNNAVFILYARNVSQKSRGFLDVWLSRLVPQLEREQRINLFQYLHKGTVSSYDFICLIILSTAIAALGLIQNSVAIIIGAMLVAPLMTPMLGAGLALVQGNWLLARAALTSIGVGFCLSLFLGWFIGICIPISTLSQQIMARTEPNILDLLVALFSGIAAAYSTARPGLMGALPGVAIAAALVPPIASAGIALALGRSSQALGAASLFGVNLILIILASAFTLYCMGVRSTPEEPSQRVWAKRTIQFLLLVTLVMCFPLGTKMISKISIERVDIKERVISSLPYNSELLDLAFEYRNGRQIINIELGTPTQISAGDASKFTNELRKVLRSNALIKVKMVKIWVDSPVAESVPVTAGNSSDL